MVNGQSDAFTAVQQFVLFFYKILIFNWFATNCTDFHEWIFLFSENTEGSVWEKNYLSTQLFVFNFEKNLIQNGKNC